VLTVAQAARMYDVPLIDYGDLFRGVLIGSGCGLMMGLMDELPIRYCIDADTMRGREWRLVEFIRFAERAEGVAVAGWFSYSDPTPLVEALTGSPAPVYSGHIVLPLPGHTSDLREFVERCWERFG
jgi:hypothetical protein